LRQPVFPIAPEAFDGVEFGRVGRKEQQSEIGREAERPCFVERPIIEQEEREAGRVGGGKMIEEQLKALRIEGGQFQKEALPRERLDRAVQVEALEMIGRRQERVDTTGGDPAAQDGQEPTATFVLHPQPPLPIALLLRTGYARLELGVERGLELNHLLGLFFGWERRGALSFALSL
jgi:hypothetical protein